MIKARYLMPDYYPEFRCKGDACRNSCCTGWNIEISLEEYLRLIGVDCSTELRRRLDCAFYTAKEPSPTSYAYIKPNIYGDCHLRDEDGLCALQKELGEDALPAICRYYPRSFQPKLAYECSCSASCERLVEMLIERKDRLTFIEEERCFDAPAEPLEEAVGLKRYYREIRRKCVAILQNRAGSFAERMIILGRFTKGLSAAADAPSYIEGFAADTPFDADGIEVDRVATLTAQIELAEVFEGFSPTIADCNRDVVKNLKLKDGNLAASCELLIKALKHLDRIAPDSEIALENLMVNHLFYSRFPFSEDGEGVWDDYVSYSASFLFLRYFVAGFMADETTKEAFIDMVAKVFRFIEHSRFDLNADIILGREGLTDSASVEKLLLSAY